MNRLLIATLAAALAATPLCAADAADAPAAKAKPAAKKAAKASAGTFKSDDERTLYGYGYCIGQNIGSFGFSDAEVRAIADGLRAAAMNKPAAVDMGVFRP